MKIASWNVNSIKQRQDHVLKWVETHQIDVLLLQELKGEAFPHEVFEAAGYHAQVKAQKARNGVAILTKGEEKASLITDQLPGYEDDEQARYLEVEYKGHRIIGIYLPNGNPYGTEKFDYKMEWMAHLYAHLKSLRDQDIEFIIGGDFNVIPEPRDCHDPVAWEGDALYCQETHESYRKMVNIGLYDAFRICNEAPEKYTFWDYQAGAWPKNNGIRIDHFLLSPVYTDRLQSCTIDSEPRGWDKPSDHTPITIEIESA